LEVLLDDGVEFVDVGVTACVRLRKSKVEEALIAYEALTRCAHGDLGLGSVSARGR